MARTVVERHVVVARILADVWEGVEAPAKAAAPGDVGGVDEHVSRRARKAEHVRAGGPPELRLLEARLVKDRSRRAQPVYVAASVVRRQLPPRLGGATSLPHGACRPWLEHGRAEVAHLGKRGGVERRGVEGLSPPATRHAARIEDRRFAGGPPRIELEDVVARVLRPRRVARPVLLEQHVRRLELLVLVGAVIEVGVAVAVAVARAAARGAPVREPEA
mmetsp:Transcript_45515/g.106233  ORF Transcript_45515/g.106233 Transcript_45515/m.106233 type:complete len:219 (-) Transcript_45515:210-866(-)